MKLRDRLLARFSENLLGFVLVGRKFPGQRISGVDVRRNETVKSLELSFSYVQMSPPEAIAASRLRSFVLNVRE